MAAKTDKDGATVPGTGAEAEAPGAAGVGSAGGGTVEARAARARAAEAGSSKSGVAAGSGLAVGAGASAFAHGASRLGDAIEGLTANDPDDGSARPGGPVVSRRAALRLTGVAVGGLVAAGAAWQHNRSVPNEWTRGGNMYDYLTNRTKFRSPSFMVANRLADSIPVFGSSELSFLPEDCRQVPHAVFGWNDYGLDCWTVGEGYNQGLWHAIAIGAYARAIEEADAPTSALADGVFDARTSNKMVFVISPQWFFEGGVPNNATQTQFGYELWQGLCQNEHVDPARVDYLARRLKNAGIDAKKVDAARRATLPDTLNDLAFGFAESYQLRRDLIHVRELGDTMPFAKRVLEAENGVPDWDRLVAEATAEAEAQTTTNDYGFLDSIWLDHIKGDYDAGKLKDFYRNRTLLNAPAEDADLDCCLGVANDCGVDLLCVLQPFPGDWTDYEGLAREDREQRYELIRQCVANHGFKLADFSDQEYTRYFINDGTHLGWLGWLAVDRAIYEFAMGE